METGTCPYNIRKEIAITLISCPECNNTISSNANSCPRCGHKKSCSGWVIGCIGVAILLFVPVIIGDCGGDSPRSTYSSSQRLGTSSNSSVFTGQGKPIKTENIALSRSAEEEIRDFAKREYPNDYSMQQYVYENQTSAHRYMSSVADSEVKKIATREYPYDYSMQKYTYDNQFSAKRYMSSVADSEVKKIATREYPYDYSMQKYTYDNQFSAKQYITAMPTSNAKSRAQREYPNDYSMQKYTYDRIISR